jgi:hypothetical protein
MRKLIILFAINLFASIAFSDQAQHSIYSQASQFFTKSPTPSWVKECPFSTNFPANPTENGPHRLLYDVQYNWEEKTYYQHGVKKALNKAGIEGISQLHIDFDPSYEKIVFHSLRIIREGKSSDRFESSRFEIVNDEEDLSKFHRGKLKLVCFLEDTRIGDILEYSFSTVGVHPFTALHYNTLFYFNSETAVDIRFYRLLVPSKINLVMKPFYTSIEPTIIDISPTHREITWQASNCEPIPYEQHVPSWYNPLPRVQISERASWAALVKKIIPYYSFSEDFKASSMVDLINEWKQKADDPIKQATLAVRFVQDEIRFLGFEEGLSSIRPHEPTVVFERRFGDCKDKTVLLQTLLKLMGIPSTPVLVNITRGKKLPDILPFLGAFDHVILQIQIGDKNYYVDSTIALQGGDLEHIDFPDYHWGLPIADQVTGLIQMPSSKKEKPLEIISDFIIDEANTAKLTITTHSYGRDANVLRSQLENKGIKKISENYCNHTHRKYKGAILISPLQVTDNRESNTITTIETYRVPLREMNENKLLKLNSYVIADYLHKDIHPDRTVPYILRFPMWVKEEISVEDRFNLWQQENDSFNLSNEIISFSHSRQSSGDSMHLFYELKHHTDHLQPSQVSDYWKMLNQIEQKEVYNITIKKNTFPNSHEG